MTKAVTTYSVQSCIFAVTNTVGGHVLCSTQRLVILHFLQPKTTHVIYLLHMHVTNFNTRTRNLDSMAALSSGRLSRDKVTLTNSKTFRIKLVPHVHLQTPKPNQFIFVPRRTDDKSLAKIYQQITEILQTQVSTTAEKLRRPYGYIWSRTDGRTDGDTDRGIQNIVFAAYKAQFVGGGGLKSIHRAGLRPPPGTRNITAISINRRPTDEATGLTQGVYWKSGI